MNFAQNGILVIDKPTGTTSRAMVDATARLVPGARVGHAGTLDPLATGVLVVCVGPATRLVETIQGLAKTYQVEIRLGARSDTLDADGRIEEDDSPPIPSAGEIAVALAPFRGVIQQTPPQFSALKVAGRRAYDLARKGSVVELKPRPVRIDRIAVLDYAWPILALEVDCGGGTYIRSLARDVGEKLGSSGYVQTLRRTRIGGFTLDQAVDPGVLVNRAAFESHLLDPVLAVQGLTQIVLDPAQRAAVALGKRIPVGESGLAAPNCSKPIALVDQDGALVALAELDLEGGWLQPRKVLI